MLSTKEIWPRRAVAAQDRNGRRSSIIRSAANGLNVGMPIKLSDIPTEDRALASAGRAHRGILATDSAYRSGDISTHCAKPAPLLRCCRKKQVNTSRCGLTDKTKGWQETKLGSKILDKVKAAGRTSLTAPEGKQVCDAYGIRGAEGRRRDVGRGSGKARCRAWAFQSC